MKLCYNVLVCLIVLHYFCCSNNCFILSGNSGWWKQNLHVPWLEIIPTINAHCAICFPYFPKKLFSICIPPLSFVADILAHFLWLRTKNFWTVVFCRWTVNFTILSFHMFRFLLSFVLLSIPKIMEQSTINKEKLISFT